MLFARMKIIQQNSKKQALKKNPQIRQIQKLMNIQKIIRASKFYKP